MEHKLFQHLPTSEVAQIVMEAGTKVCVFPTNGTRRWLFLEHPPTTSEEFASEYLNKSQTAHLSLYQLIFDHGLSTLVSPIFGPDLMERGGDYMTVISEGLARVANHPDFLSFYEANKVRVRFFGDYRHYFAGTPYSYLCELFDTVTQQTAHFEQNRLFYGLFAHDPTETVVQLGVQYHAEHGRMPSKDQVIEMYYGEYVSPADLFIGFDKFAVFDAPLIMTGNEDLYFTVSPSPYMSQVGLRNILYDHLYSRRDSEPDYFAMPLEAWTEMREFYRANQDKALGVGVKHPLWGYWYPHTQVSLPLGSSNYKDNER